MNMMHCAAVNDHTDIVAYIVDDLQMKELDKEDQVWQVFFLTAKQKLQFLKDYPKKLHTK